MTMQRTIVAVGFVAMVCAPLLVVRAQPPRPAPVNHELGAVSVAIEVPVAQPIPLEKANQPVTWRIYAERDELLLKLRLVNESQTPLWLDRSRLQRAIEVRMGGPLSVNVNVRGLDEIELYDERLPTVVASEQIALSADTFVALTVGLRRQDGLRFGPATYSISIDFTNLRAALRDSQGAVWTGRAPEDGSRQFVVRIQLPTSRQEEAVHYRLEADDRAMRDQVAAALDAYTRAADANPEDLSSVLGMAHMYIRLGLFREAIPLYEKVLAGRPRDERIAFFLASAHLGIGDEAKALNVLRGAGTAETDIQLRMQEARERAGKGN